MRVLQNIEYIQYTVSSISNIGSIKYKIIILQHPLFKEK